MEEQKNSGFNKDRDGTGTKEWSEHSYNIQKGCRNGCVYCFARYSAICHWKYVESIAKWTEPEIRPKKVFKKWSKVNGVIMFPTTHDIDKYNISECIEAITRMAQADNDILIVSKPDSACIRLLTQQLTPYISQIMFRFTIGNVSDEILKVFEPYAPDFASRHLSLKIAHKAGYRTSISAEPLLGGLGALQGIYEFCIPYVTDGIWVGKMNKMDQRIMENPTGRLAEEIENIKILQQDNHIIKIYDRYNVDPMIKWKDSIKKVINQYEKS